MVTSGCPRLERVLPEDQPLGDPLGPGGPDVILAEDFQPCERTIRIMIGAR